MSNVSMASTNASPQAWGNKLLWILSGLYALAALGSIASGKTGAMLLCLLTATLANPAVTRFLYEQWSIPLKGWLKAGVVFCLMFAIGTSFREPEKAAPTVTRGSSAAAVVAQASPSKTVHVPPAPHKSKQSEYQDTITREIKSLKKGFNAHQYTGSKDTIIMGVVLFSMYAKLYDEGAQYPLSAEQQHLRTEFRTLVIGIQRRAYPVFRKAWTKIVSDALWEHDIEAHTLGSRNDTIELTGGVFAANAGMKQVNDSLWETLNLLRFKQSRYRWYKGASESTYWKITSPKDSDLAYFDNGNARIVTGSPY